MCNFDWQLFPTQSIYYIWHVYDFFVVHVLSPIFIQYNIFYMDFSAEYPIWLVKKISVHMLECQNLLKKNSPFGFLGGNKGTEGKFFCRKNKKFAPYGIFPFTNTTILDGLRFMLKDRDFPIFKYFPWPWPVNYQYQKLNGLELLWLQIHVRDGAWSLWQKKYKCYV